MFHKLMLFTFLTSGSLFSFNVVAQEYVFFELENETPDATFGWDLFSGDYAGPHGSTLDDAGAVLSVNPPGGFVSSTMNLYAFTTLPEYTITLNNLATDQPFLNIALQLATTDLIDGTQIEPFPSEFIELGELSQIGGQFPVYYYWIEWNGLAAAEDFSAIYTGFTPHVSFAGARASYFNTPEPLDITFGKQVLLGDVNCDGAVNLLDVNPFIDAISSGTQNDKADMNQDGAVNLLDVDPFVAAVAAGG